jgi:filamentous hemagglutinin family protein
VSNTGTVEAKGGLAALTADGGTVNASGTVTGQQVELTAKDVTQAADASLHANGNGNGNGGNITITAQGQVELGGSSSGVTFLLWSGNYIDRPNLTLNGTINALAVELIADKLPTAIRGGGIMSGTGSITQDGSATNVVQTSDKLLIGWRDFDIAAGESINFLQPNANAAVVNKIFSGGVTTIDGALNANGRVFVLNPYGIVVGNTGTINANSITLVAGDILDSYENVLSGDTWSVSTNPRDYGPSSGLVKNSGDIHAANGVTLIGSQVMNMTSGRIYTWGGNIAMVAGGRVQVSQNADRSMSRVDALTATNNALVANDGRITADNSYVKLDAYTSTQGQGEVARSTGQIDALNRTDTMSAPGELTAGNILVSGRSTSGASGTVNIRGRLVGQNVTVHSDGNLSFSGGTLILRQRSSDPDFNAITLEGNRIIIGSVGVGTTIEGNAILRGVGIKPVFDQQGSFNVVGGTQSLVDIEPLQF